MPTPMTKLGEVARAAADFLKDETTKPPLFLCSKPGCKNPRADSDSTNPWCNEHRTEYARQYEQTKVTKAERHGYAEGVRAMKELLAQEFDRLGFSTFSAVEVRDLILQAPGPKLPD